MASDKTNSSEHNKKQDRRTKRLSMNIWVVLLALAAVVGYIAGTYHYQIEAAIGPVFGYKAHDGSLDLTSLQQTYSNLAANFDGKLDTRLLIEGANRGLVDAAGDHYTVYMSPTEASDYQKTLSGNIGGGIGAEIGLKNNQVTIIRTLKGNPAEKVGLAAGDTILNINDQPTSGWTVEKAVGQIRGDEGTTVKLMVKRGEIVKEYTVTRAIINNPSVESSVTGELGILTITRFDEETASLARLAARDFKKQGVKSIILDLRGNGGGYIDAARDIAGLWLRNEVVVTQRTGTTVRSTLRTGDDAILSGLPTAVLINGGSASASEIVAGALQDYKVAKIVGEKSFGKGTVQQLLPLDGGAQLKVTIARWYTPGGRNITKDGVNPDTAANLSQSDIDNSIDPQMDAAKKLLGL
ncbi:S41 family peptidase [Candidatus Saccharibacteria bacterium]|nr:S41 family peptidase [Candidatus Saccharibacteria bacterium]